MIEEPIARWSGGICKTCGNYTHSCKCNHPKSPILDELFSTKTAPTPCPTCGGLREQHLERQLSLAQTEIKGHMRVKDELQGRIAELEKDWETDADYVRMAERIKELEKLLNEAMENLIWCGGSADFGWGGKAQIGYDKGPRATIAAIHEALKSRA